MVSDPCNLAYGTTILQDHFESQLDTMMAHLNRGSDMMVIHLRGADEAIGCIVRDQVRAPQEELHRVCKHRKTLCC